MVPPGLYWHLTATRASVGINVSQRETLLSEGFWENRTPGFEKKVTGTCITLEGHGEGVELLFRTYVQAEEEVRWCCCWKPWGREPGEPLPLWLMWSCIVLVCIFEPALGAAAFLKCWGCQLESCAPPQQMENPREAWGKGSSGRFLQERVY